MEKLCAAFPAATRAAGVCHGCWSHSTATSERGFQYGSLSMAFHASSLPAGPVQSRNKVILNHGVKSAPADRNVVLCQSQPSRNRSDGAVVGSSLQERSVKESQNGSLFSRFESSPSREVTKGPEEFGAEKEAETVSPYGRLIDNGMVYRERFVIRCYEVGVNRTASIESIANLLQEIGCNHAQSVGFSNDGFATSPLMRANNLIWVTTRMHIQMDSYPVWGDVVEIDTWFQGEGHIKSRRDWIIKMAKSGEIIGRGSSSWVTMNQNTRRLSKVSPEIQAEYMQHCPDPPRFSFPEECMDKIPHLVDPTDFVCSYLRPRRGDLDMNKHVNNVTYIGWMLESIPSDIFEQAELTDLTLEYRREVSGGEMVESLASYEPLKPQGVHEPVPENGAIASAREAELASSGQKFIHTLRIQGTDKEINKGRTVWRKKSFCNLSRTA